MTCGDKLTNSPSRSLAGGLTNQQHERPETPPTSFLLMVTWKPLCRRRHHHRRTQHHAQADTANSIMSAPFKVRAQALSKGEKMKGEGQETKRNSKKKQRKASGAGGSSTTKGQTGKKVKANGGASTGGQEPKEAVVYEPEAAGEDDHAFFDDDENADYAKFMLALDSSELTTFSKRAKDGVAVPPTSKKTKKPRKQGDIPTMTSSQEHAPQTPHEHRAVVVPSTTAGTADGVDTKGQEIVGHAATNGTVAPTTSTKTVKKAEATVDAKRRTASTAGWAVDESGPQRLPIKTRRGVLKPNERMQQSGTSAVSANGHKNADEAIQERTDESGDGHDGKPDLAGNGALENGGIGDGDDDVMSVDSENSVYDSADSEAENRPKSSEFDDGMDVGAREGVGNGQAPRGVDLAVLRQRRFSQKKALIAELCEAILGAPEESLMRPKNVAKGEEERSRMEQLFDLVSQVFRCATGSHSKEEVKAEEERPPFLCIETVPLSSLGKR